MSHRAIGGLRACPQAWQEYTTEAASDVVVTYQEFREITEDEGEERKRKHCRRRIHRNRKMNHGDSFANESLKEHQVHGTEEEIFKTTLVIKKDDEPVTIEGMNNESGSEESCEKRSTKKFLKSQNVKISTGGDRGRGNYKHIDKDIAYDEAKLKGTIKDAFNKLGNMPREGYYV